MKTKVRVVPVKVRSKRMFCVLWWSDRKRHRRFFSGRAPAEAHASALRDSLSRTAATLFAEFESLSVAEAEDLAAILRAARKRGVSIGSVWSAWSKSSTAALASQPVGELVARFVSERELTGNLRPKYLAGLRAYLNAFVRGRESQPVSEFNRDALSEWFLLRKESPAAMKSNLGRLSAFFGWCVKSGCVLANPCDSIEKPKVEAKTPTVLSVRQAARLLALCLRQTPALLPWLTLGLFAGLRPEEADRIEWASVDLSAGHVVIDAAASKVRRRRVVSLQPVAVKWLAFARDARLPLPHSTRRRLQADLRRAYGWKAWPQDILRHSAASYLLAYTQDAAKVASALGNSPTILLRHYHALVTQPQAARFWAKLAPPSLTVGASERLNL